MSDAFDKLRSSLNRGITTISVKTSSSLEKTKLKTHIESLTNDIQKLYSEAGDLVAFHYAGDSIPRCSVSQLYSITDIITNGCLHVKSVFHFFLDGISVV